MDSPADTAADTPSGPLVHDLHDGPDVPEHLAASRRAAAAARRVIAGLTASAADPVTLHEVADALEHLAETLAPHQVTTRWAGPPGVPPDPSTSPHAFEAHPLIGPSHPLAPPIRIERHGDRSVGTVTFGHVYEGPRGAVHGGVVAAMFDIVLISAAAIANVAGLTGTLTVRYRAATPLYRTIRYEGWVDEVHERKVVVRGRSTVDDQVTAEAEGVFVRAVPRPPEPRP